MGNFKNNVLFNMLGMFKTRSAMSSFFRETGFLQTHSKRPPDSITPCLIMRNPPISPCRRKRGPHVFSKPVFFW